MNASYDFDYIVIGSGFGGSVSACRLTEKGYSVGVIEMGKRWRAEDFPKTNWDARRWMWLPGMKMYGFYNLRLFRHVMVLSGNAVGGGSITYANALLVAAFAAYRRDPSISEIASRSGSAHIASEPGHLFGRIFEKWHNIPDCDVKRDRPGRGRKAIRRRLRASVKALPDAMANPRPEHQQSTRIGPQEPQETDPCRSFWVSERPAPVISQSASEPADLSVVKIPVFVVNGDSDRMVPIKNSQDLAQRLPNSSLIL